MRFYRLHIHTDGGSSAGYQWFTDKHLAEVAQRKAVKENPDEGEATIEPIEISPTRKGLRAALNRYAGYPDNG